MNTIFRNIILNWKEAHQGLKRAVTKLIIKKKKKNVNCYLVRPHTTHENEIFLKQRKTWKNFIIRIGLDTIGSNGLIISLSRMCNLLSLIPKNIWSD